MSLATRRVQCFAHRLDPPRLGNGPRSLRRVAGRQTGGQENCRASTPGTSPCGPARKFDEFDIPGAGDTFRGDWADLVNYFYLAAIQENYHLGNRSVRQSFSNVGTMHFGTYRLTAPDGTTTRVLMPDFVEDWRKAGAQKAGQIMLSEPLETSRQRAAGRPLQADHCHAQSDAQGRTAISISTSTAGCFATSPPRAPNGPKIGWTSTWAKSNSSLATTRLSSMPAYCGPPGPTARLPSGPLPICGPASKPTRDDVTFADDYDRMWPDSWSGQQKIYFFSWDGTSRTWKLPAAWQASKTVTLHPLTPAGRAPGVVLPVVDRSISPTLLPQVPYILLP